jgi:putative acetyltransferase
LSAADLTIRPARDADSEALFGLLGSVFAEYPGCFLERAELPELTAPATSFAELGGLIWVAERRRGERQVVAGLVAGAPGGEPGLFELKKLYVHARARGLGLGRRLIELVEREAGLRGARRVQLWSDTRFTTAHAVYERLGYARLPGTRELHDVSASVEYHFSKQLGDLR